MEKPSPIKSQEVARLLQQASGIEVPEEVLRRRINEAVMRFYKADVIRLEKIEDIARMVCEFTCRENLPQSLVRARPQFEVLEGARMTHRSPTSFMLLVHKINQSLGLDASVRTDVMGEHAATELRLLLDQMVAQSRDFSFKQMTGVAAGLLGSGSPMGALLSDMPPGQGALSILKMPPVRRPGLLGKTPSLTAASELTECTSEPGDPLNTLTKKLLMAVLDGTVSYAAAYDSLLSGFKARGFVPGCHSRASWTGSDPERQRREQCAAHEFLLTMPLIQGHSDADQGHYHLVMTALGLDDESGHHLFGQDGWTEICAVRLSFAASGKSFPWPCFARKIAHSVMRLLQRDN